MAKREEGDFDESRKADWDARNIFPAYLEGINQEVNRIKMALGMRENSITEIPKIFNAYFLSLKCYYLNLRPFFKEDKKKKMDALFEAAWTNVNKLYVSVQELQEYPTWLEKDLENIQNILHEKRVRLGVVIPMGRGKDKTGIEGWEGVS